MDQKNKLPKHLIVMDKRMEEIGHREKLFYLQVEVTENSTDLIDLDGAVTPLDARKMARDIGYEPTHWMTVGSSHAIKF